MRRIRQAKNRRFVPFARCERGAAAVEYALVAAAIALLLGSVIGAIGGEINGILTSLLDALRSANTGAFLPGDGLCPICNVPSGFATQLV